MIILLSPSKTLIKRPFPQFIEPTTPKYLQEAEQLVESVNKLGKKLPKTLGVSQKIADLNEQRFKEWSIDGHKTAHPAIYLYAGDVYNGLSIASFEKHNLEYAQQHLRVLSGLYGELRPLDRIMPYRLEMSTKPPGKWGKDLYKYWDDKIADGIEQSFPSFILNCASNEYAKSVTPYFSKNLVVITPRFLHDSGDGPKAKMTFAKYGRGLLARWAIANEIRDPKRLEEFDYEGFKFSQDLSRDNEPTFIAPKDFSLMGRFTKS
jgi:cytoplasmic iron level regulating protein YaaA (DUF328/UPF0246 family)